MCTLSPAATEARSRRELHVPAPAASYVAPARLDEYVAPAASYGTPRLSLAHQRSPAVESLVYLDEYLAPAPSPLRMYLSLRQSGTQHLHLSLSTSCLRLQRTQGMPHQHLLLCTSLQLPQRLTWHLRPWINTLRLRRPVLLQRQTSHQKT